MSDNKDKSLRVWMLLPNFYPHVGGAERQCLKLSRELITQGVKVTVITRGMNSGLPAYEVIDTVPVKRILRIRPFEIAVFYWFLFLLKNRHHFDVLHVHMLHEHTMGAVIAGKLLNKPVIIKMASSGKHFDPLALSKNGRFPFNRFIVKSMYYADKIISVAGSITVDLKNWGVSKDRIVEIPNGVEQVPSISATDKDKIRQELKIPEKACVVLRVGTFLPIKGVVHLFDAWNHIVKLAPHAYLVSVGGDSIPSDFQSFINNNNESVRVILNQDDVLPFYQAADIFVLPSLAEGLSNALLEAGMCALPSVVTDVGGNSNVVSNGVNGFLVPSGDPDRLADAIVNLINDGELRQEMSSQSKKITKEYSLPIIAKRYLHLYQGLLQEKGSA